MRSLPYLIFSLVLAGCAVVATHRMDERLGPPDPARYDQAPPPVAPAPDYWKQVRPILDRRCVTCHACYDAPCQLNLSSYAGLTRGASTELVYTDTRLSNAAPTRLGFDAQSNSEWRGKGFFPVLNERTPSPEANREGSTLYRLLALKQANPGPTGGPLPDKDFDFSLDRNQVCPTVEGADAFARSHPQWGMPYGLPALSRQEHETLAGWIEAGAPYRPLPAPPAIVATRVEQWERLLNGDALQAQLAARYIYEHWFIGHLYFDEAPERRFELVRSRSAPGEPIDVIATRRPYDDPGVARVYYRLRPTEATPVAKTYMPLALNPARMARLRQWFFDAPITVGALPGYAPEVASNPFAAFRALPVDARYRFMLDDARFTLMGFMKGPVCRGQVALNVITDHFWVLFVAPENEVSRKTQALLDATQPNLRMPAEDSSVMGSLAWRAYARAERQYLADKTRFMLGSSQARPRLEDLWDGDGSNPNAALTVFRHFDSASVVQGLAGERPQTVLLMGYPLFERMHYLLVAGFDVYGNVAHQLATRLYMDFLRMEGEQNFLTLLPAKDRQKVLNTWYRGRKEPRIREFADATAYFPGETGVRYRGSDTLGELYKSLQARMKPVRDRKRLDLTANGFSAEEASQLARINAITGKPASLMPEHSLVALREADNSIHVVSLIRNSAHSNVAELFKEEARRLPAEDTLLTLPGFVGAYPNALFQVEAADLPRFVAAVRDLGNEQDLLHLVQRFGVRRADSGFWPLSDRLHDHWQKISPQDAAILDYSRLENR